MSGAFPGLRRLDLRSNQAEDRAEWHRRCTRTAGLSGEADEVARKVIEAVRNEGDAAIVRFTKEFERRDLDAKAFEIDPAQWTAAADRVPSPLRVALERATENIRVFHQTQIPESTGLESEETRLQSRVGPLRRVAVYAPGGTASYPSSVLMAGIPAKVAGVHESILLTPNPTDAVLLAAKLAGIDRVFAIGGAQAIAAVAFGTATVPRVDKIVGPGNAFVTAAKRQVFGICDIDGIAGPSEILVIADHSADPRVVAADLLSQAEHDVLACPILIAFSTEMVDEVDEALRQQLESLPRREMARKALEGQGAAVLVEDRDQAVAEANAYASEHVALLVDEPEDMAEHIHAAGAIFLGPWSPEAAGDYTAGPSHVLPTAGAARFGSPLGVWDFVKYTSILYLGPDALRNQAEAIVTLARAEGLEAHARAVELRLETKP